MSVQPSPNASHPPSPATKKRISWSSLPRSNTGPGQGGEDSSTHRSGGSSRSNATTFTGTVNLYIKTFTTALATYLLSTLLTSLCCVALTLPAIASAHWRLSEIASAFYDGGPLTPSVYGPTAAEVAYLNASVAPVSLCRYDSFYLEPIGEAPTPGEWKLIIFTAGVVGPNAVLAGSMFGGGGLKRAQLLVAAVGVAVVGYMFIAVGWICAANGETPNR